MDIFLSYPETTRRMWFGDRCVAALQAVAPTALNPLDRVMSPAEVATLAGNCRVIVLDRLTPVTAAMMDALPNLLAVVRGGVDIRRIDVAAASARGILVTQVQAAYGAAVAELALGLMLDAARGISQYNHVYHQGAVPDEQSGQQIGGAVVGIIGYGVIARHLAGTLIAMGAKVMVHDPYTTAPAPARNGTLDEVVAAADYLVPLAVATPETRNLIGEAAFARMKPTAWLINCSRGDLVDEDALLAALNRGDLAGAALDVGWAPDQRPSPGLARHPRVIATPHIGGMTQQSFESQSMQAVEQARLVLQGRLPPGAVNAEAATRLQAMGGVPARVQP